MPNSPQPSVEAPRPGRSARSGPAGRAGSAPGPGRRAEPGDRRALQVQRRLLGRPPPQQVVIERRVVGGAPAADQVADPGDDDAAAEDRPGRRWPTRSGSRRSSRRWPPPGRGRRCPRPTQCATPAMMSSNSAPGRIGQVGPGEGLAAPGAAARVGHAARRTRPRSAARPTAGPSCGARPGSGRRGCRRRAARRARRRGPAAGAGGLGQQALDLASRPARSSAARGPAVRRVPAGRALSAVHGSGLGAAAQPHHLGRRSRGRAHGQRRRRRAAARPPGATAS